jgi:uncharacterized protein (DUF2236 family)
MARPDISASTSIQPFAADSTIRRVHSEGVLLLGGGRAVLMQIAHPLVAQGVADHSSFRDRPFERLLRTLRPTLALVFGTQTELDEAARSVNAIHERVVGEGYQARDPELLFWVLATLIDTTLELHARFLRPLRPDEGEAYYQDMLTVGDLLGINRQSAPADLRAFRGYVDGMVASLAVTDTARAIARDVLRGSPRLSPAFWPLREVTAGLLPERLRGEYGLSWGPGRERVLRSVEKGSRVVLPHLPLALRGTPSLLLPPSYKHRG